jgi:SAM-dependent methyltransferase
MNLLDALGPVRLFARALRRSANLLDRIGRSQLVAMTKHPRRPVATDVAEAYYGKQYLRWLTPLIERLPTSARVIDVGCGAGRLLLAMAAMRSDLSLTGVDISPVDAALARQGAAMLAHPPEIIEDECVRYLSRQKPNSADLILFTEVSFFMPDYLSALREISRVLRPGGILFASFRGRWFNVLHSIAEGDLDSAKIVLTSYGGVLWGGPYDFRWHTCDSIRSELTKIGLFVEALYGVGVFSGRPGDPLARIASPTPELLELELAAATEFAECGRYITAVARRRPPTLPTAVQ